MVVQRTRSNFEVLIRIYTDGSLLLFFLVAPRARPTGPDRASRTGTAERNKFFLVIIMHMHPHKMKYCEHSYL